MEAFKIQKSCGKFNVASLSSLIDFDQKRTTLVTKSGGIKPVTHHTHARETFSLLIKALHPCNLKLIQMPCPGPST